MLEVAGGAAPIPGAPLHAASKRPALPRPQPLALHGVRAGGVRRLPPHTALPASTPTPPGSP